MPTKVFISYRRDDSAGHAGRVHDRLERELGRDLLFMDVDAMPLGLNFVKVVSDEVAKCDVLLAIIGPHWLEVRDENGKRRLDSPTDFVRIEIAAALKRDIPVIPILLEGTRVPKAEVLPNDLKELALRNGLDVRHASFHKDMDKLIGTLKGQSGRAGTSPRAVAVPPGRLRSPENERGKTLPQAGNDATHLPSPSNDALFERAALEHWESVKGTTDPGRLREFLAGYSNSRMGRLAHDALQRLATTAWRKVDKRSEEALDAFIDTYAGTAEIAGARETKAKLRAAREAAEWASEQRDAIAAPRRWGKRLAWAVAAAVFFLVFAVAILLRALQPMPPFEPGAANPQPASVAAPEPASAVAPDDPTVPDAARPPAASAPAPMMPPASQKASPPPPKRASPQPAPPDAPETTAPDAPHPAQKAAPPAPQKATPPSPKRASPQPVPPDAPETTAPPYPAQKAAPSAPQKAAPPAPQRASPSRPEPVASEPQPPAPGTQSGEGQEGSPRSPKIGPASEYEKERRARRQEQSKEAIKDAPKVLKSAPKEVAKEAPKTAPREVLPFGFGGE